MSVARRIQIATRGFRGEVVRIGYVEDDLTAKLEDTTLAAVLTVPTLEAKIVEGSAVVKGSNHATPTMNIEAVKSGTSNTEPSKDTQKNTQYRNTIFKTSS